jgi:hypothetical protein
MPDGTRKFVTKESMRQGNSNIMGMVNNNNGLQMEELAYNASNLYHHWVFQEIV